LNFIELIRASSIEGEFSRAEVLKMIESRSSVKLRTTDSISTLASLRSLKTLNSEDLTVYAVTPLHLMRKNEKNLGRPGVFPL
jgi:hypothetical protein